LRVSKKGRAPRNKTITLTGTDRELYAPRLVQVHKPVTLEQIIDRTICQDTLSALDWLPAESIDLVFADPPYNLAKSFNGRSFSRVSSSDYEEWLESWIGKLPRLLKSTASIYVCGDWRSSAAIQKVLETHFIVRNRVTWEREKGRGAKANWKNCSEDIWFATVSNDYVFNVEDVKLKRRVIAPYTDREGRPKDWSATGEGRFRLTHPSNIWTDLTIPFWSMAENTDHPTQKPEKLLAKIVLASSHEGQVILDPFLGSGTTSVVAKKLKRHYIGIEIDEMYCCLSEKRLDMADDDPSIQGWIDGVFWERNTLVPRRRSRKERSETVQAALPLQR